MYILNIAKQHQHQSSGKHRSQCADEADGDDPVPYSTAIRINGGPVHYCGGRGDTTK